MDYLTIQTTSVVTATLAALSAIFSAATAYRSFRMARNIFEDAKSDERLIVGAISHPELRERIHAQAVIQLPIFNKSKRKAYINGLAVYDRTNKLIEVTWAQEIDDFGSPKDASGLIGIIDSVTLYIRRNDGQGFGYARILYSHSFSNTRDVVTFDSAAPQ